MNIGYEAKRVFHNTTGLGNYSRDLVRIITHFYPENKYFLYHPKPAKKRLFTTNNTNCWEQLPRTTWDKKFYNIWRQKRIISDLKKDNITIFHGLSGEIPSGLKKASIKSVVTIHDLIFMRYPAFYSFFDRKIHYYKFKKAAQQADKIIAISQQTKNDIITYLKVPENKIQVIYQGCQAIFKQQFTTNAQQLVAQKYQLPSNFILNVGTIEARKNVLSAVKAIKNIDTTLVIVGAPTPYIEEIKNYIATHQMQHKVLFLKGLNSTELAIIYQLATIFIYPSLFEGFGIPIIEALYSKTPVITSNSGVFPEAAGPDSIYIDPTDITDIEQKIIHLLNNEAYRKEIAQKGHIFVQKFNDNTIADALMGLYKKL